MTTIVKMSGQVTFSHCPNFGRLLSCPSPYVVPWLPCLLRSRRLMIALRVCFSLPVAVVVFPSAGAVRLLKNLMVAVGLGYASFEVYSFVKPRARTRTEGALKK
jgi:hypothetical protein